MLCRIALATNQQFNVTVVSLTDAGYFGQRLREAGIPVLCCEMGRGARGLRGLLKLRSYLRAERPQIVQTWMYHADLLGGVFARLAGCRAVLWGVRNNRLYAGAVSRSARLAAKLSARLSRIVPKTIVSCSHAAAAEHVRIGYAADKMIVIPNGYDCAQLDIDPAAARRMRSEWGFAQDDFVIGMVARWDPLKDHATLITAMREVLTSHPGARCVLVGAGMNSDNEQLRVLLNRTGLGERITLAGPQSDIRAVMNALDLHVLSSISESFPNVVAEAMACGTPCVVTNVGDAALIVDRTGWVVEPSAPAALATAIRTAIDALSGAQGDALRQAARRRIVDTFSHDAMVSAFAEAWLQAMRRT